MKNENTLSNPYAIRWRPDFRYCDNKLMEVPLENFNSTEPSVTDKEAYRVTLASLRGEIAQAAGGITQGSYSLKPGEEYNPSTDFSFLHRKDFTIVELDNYINVMKLKLEESDAELSVRIKEELVAAEKKRQSLEKDSADKNNSVKE